LKEIKCKMKPINIAENFYKESFLNYNYVATNSWETFKNSWAGQLWIERNRIKITQIYETEKKRFGWNRKYLLGI
jgi:hypothetical protein